MTQWVKVLAVKLKNLSLIPGTHMIEEKKSFSSCPLTSTHVLQSIQAPHTQINKCNKILEEFYAQSQQNQSFDKGSFVITLHSKVVFSFVGFFSDYNEWGVMVHICNPSSQGV